jgi:hypothetical protein
MGAISFAYIFQSEAISDGSLELILKSNFPASTFYRICNILISLPKMSLQSIRSISSTAKRNLLNLAGKVALEDVRTTNGSKGDQWVFCAQDKR